MKIASFLAALSISALTTGLALTKPDPNQDEVNHLPELDSIVNPLHADSKTNEPKNAASTAATAVSGPSPHKPGPADDSIISDTICTYFRDRLQVRRRINMTIEGINWRPDWIRPVHSSNPLFPEVNSLQDALTSDPGIHIFPQTFKMLEPIRGTATGKRFKANFLTRKEMSNVVNVEDMLERITGKKVTCTELPSSAPSSNEVSRAPSPGHAPPQNSAYHSEAE